MVDYTAQIDALRAASLPITETDLMSEAVRKALIGDFIRMLEHEDGSRAGDDTKHVHDMRVATRRMRSVMLLLEAYFKPKAVNGFQRRLQKVARALGAVRDLDVMIDDLTRFQDTLIHEKQSDLQAAIDLLDKKRTKARKRLNAALDKADYRHLVEQLHAFLLEPGAGAKHVNGASQPVPTQVQHVLPAEIYARLALVRAYDGSIADADYDTLHELRIQFKRLRYLMSMFSTLLGKNGVKFIDEIKVVQDHLGRMQDIVVARQSLTALLESLDDAPAATVQLYIDTLGHEDERLRAGLLPVWERFDSKAVQRLLANAVAQL